MATFVLVHGAWHGGWCWQRVVPILQAAGHSVFAPTLTGLGDRAALAKPEVDLSLHVKDVLAVIQDNNINDALMAGLGYGGMVISQVAEHVAKRIENLVYIDGIVPYGGDSAFDLMPTSNRRELQEEAREHGDGWRIPPPPIAQVAISDPGDAEWVKSNLCPQPLKTFEERLPVQNIAAIHVTRSFIHCNSPAMDLFGRFAERARAEAWRYQEIAAGHEAMVTEPHKLVAALLKVCRLPETSS
jgi:pimeloyl-ACP methyl ester carboxylesterase